MADHASLRRCMRILLVAALLLPFFVQAQPEDWYQVELLVFSSPAGENAELWEATPAIAYPDAGQFLVEQGERSATASQAGAASALAAAGPTPFATLPATQRELASQASAMQRSGRYRILFHEAWLQPIENQSTAVPIVLDHSGDGGQWPALQGTIKLYRSGDLQLETNLWLNTQGEYLNSAWRMPTPPRGPASGVHAAPAQTAPAPSSAAAAGQEYPYRHAVLLDQKRGVNSGELLYIDHPMLGVVAKITALSALEPAATAPLENTPPPKPATDTPLENTPPPEPATDTPPG